MKGYSILFEDSSGQLRIIGTSATEGIGYRVIDDFLMINKYKKPYNKKCWKKDEKTTVVDIGVNSELFYIQEK